MVKKRSVGRHELTQGGASHAPPFWPVWWSFVLVRHGGLNLP